MARMFPNVPEDKRYSEKEFDEMVDVLAKVLHGNVPYAKVSEVAGTYECSLELVKVCHDKSHKDLIGSLVNAEYPLPGEGKIESCKEYKDYLNKAADLRGELKDLEKVKVLVKGKLNPLFVKNYDYIQKIDPEKFEGSVQQKRVDLSRGEYELQRKMRPKPEDMFKVYD
jgi:hypothetical protein